MHFRKPEIAEFTVVVGVQEDIVGLDVAMANFVLVVHTVKAFCTLFEPIACLGLLDRALFAVRHQRATGRELHENVVTVVGSDDVVHFQDIFVFDGC